MPLSVKRLCHRKQLCFVSSAKRQSLSFAYNLNISRIMGKQNETAPAPTQGQQPESEQKFNNEVFNPALHELECLEAGLNLDKASKQTQFFLGQLKERLQQKTCPVYHDTINQLCSYFNDADFTYTRHLELMVSAMLEVQRLQNLAIRLGADDDDVCKDELQTKETQELFFKMSLMLFDLKPIAMQQERELQKRGSNCVGYNVVEDRT